MESEDEEEQPVVKQPRRERALGTQIDDQLDDEGFATVGRGGRALIYTPESILKHLRSIVEQRGRKNTDRLEHIRTLEKLLDVAVSDYQRIRILLTLISTRFDLTSGTGSQMVQEQWKME